MTLKRNSNGSSRELTSGTPQQLANYTPQSLNEFDIDDAEIDFQLLWRSIWRHRKLILIIFSLVFITGLVVTLMMRPTYIASSNLELNTLSRSVVKFNNLQNENLGSGRYMATQLRILESRAIAKKVVEKLNLADNPEFNGKLKQRTIRSGFSALLDVFSFSKSDYDIDNTLLAEAIYMSKSSVVSLFGSNIIEVSVRSFDPELAAKMANEHVIAYIELSSDRRLNSSSEAKQFINQEIETVKERLQRSENNLTSFARENNNVDIEDTNNIILARLSNLNDSLSEVQSERIDAETTYLQSKGGSNTDYLNAIVTNEVVNSLRSEQTSLRSQYLTLSKTFKPKYPEMVELKAKINDIETNIQTQVQTILGNLKSNYEQLASREKSLESELQIVKEELFDLQDKAVTYNILKREWEANKSLYGELLDRVKTLGVASGMELNVATMIDEAVASDFAVSPKIKFNLFLSALLGLGLGVGLALILMFLDDKINNVRLLESITNIPNLVVLPDVESNADAKSIDLRVLKNPNDIFSESVHSLRTAIDYTATLDNNAVQTVAITSSISGEGKSAISTNLAISYANSGKKVLLLETDLRKPRLSKIFGVNIKKGLVQGLSDGEPVKPHKVEEIPNLSIIFAGRGARNPIELLSSKAMETFLMKCRDNYDIVVLDCPPILGLADTVSLSSLVDHLLLVVCAHKVPISAVQNSINRLRMVNSPILGTVFNRADSRISGYDYYAYGYYDEPDQERLVEINT